MILDEMVEMYPPLQGLVNGATIVRVPWHLLSTQGPEKIFQVSDLPLSMIATKRSERTGQSIVDWSALRLPYDRLALVSGFHEPAVLIVTSRFVESIQRQEIEALLCYEHESRCCVAVFTYQITQDGTFAAACNPMNTSVQHEYAVRHLLTREATILAQLGNTQSMVHAALVRQYDYRISLEGRLGVEGDHLAFGIILTATAALFSCKNIEQREVSPDAPLQARRIKRGHLPLYRYTVLAVKPRMGTAHSLVLNDTGSATAIHWVRGHFKRYTDENKLFGKYTGLYWWQPHLAGTAPRFVQKDYQLVGSAR